ncbi:uracil-DNA glycosylase [Mariniblastus fucicola]|uniref:Type-5 uracil-DNA glycosylase n=1 Tax=Mariniblastus fucicola TaxID=980251 RepID=A0A5B9P4P9_9BACT|nr:uracil-DNA glycosylase [Mariniblastus fucicola]QEG21368.1 Uracil DNA glycosylase superfamily protein [Mariniblastus fucicola]
MPKRKAPSKDAELWQKLQRRVVRCKKCPRLIEHCKAIAKKKRKAYADQKYWGKPVENFGDGRADLLVMGLAPGAHGANRTGRMFTGDRSGDWLYRAMHKFGFASQAESIDRNDGLELVNSVVSGVCHCAPPDNKPNRQEVANCQPFLEQTVAQVQPKVVLALGRLAWTETLRLAKEIGWLSPEDAKPPKFSHGAEHQFECGVWILASYHPSQQNTFTGRLTEPMFDAVFARARKLTR